MSRNRKSHRNFLFLRLSLFFSLTSCFSYFSFRFAAWRRTWNTSAGEKCFPSPILLVLLVFLSDFLCIFLGKSVMSSSTTNESSSTPVTASGKKHVYPSASQQHQQSKSHNSSSTNNMPSGSGQQRSTIPKHHHHSGNQSYIQQQQQTLMQQPSNPHQYYSLRWNNYQSWVQMIKFDRLIE